MTDHKPEPAKRERYDPSKKANPKKKPHPWGAWAPGWLKSKDKK